MADAVPTIVRRRRRVAPCPDDPPAAAQAAHLRYVTDAQPGFRRLRAGRGFRYVNADGASIRDKEILRRIRSLAIPPAWREVWICPAEHGHLQAVGRDSRGRKQYRYHPLWRAVRDETKYARLVDFARALPRIRGRVRSDLARRGLCRETVLATVVRLLESTAIRVGNESYARQNGSFGLTTLRSRHVTRPGLSALLRVPGQGRQAPPREGQRPPCRGDRPPVPGSSRPGAVPVPRRNWTEPDDRLRRHQRLPAPDRRGLVHGEGLSNLGRHRSRGSHPLGAIGSGAVTSCAAAACPRSRRTRQRSAGKHSRDLSQVLCPPRRHRGVPRETARQPTATSPSRPARVPS